MCRQVVYMCAIFMQADTELCLLTGQFEDFVLQFLDRWASIYLQVPCEHYLIHVSYN